MRREEKRRVANATTARAKRDTFFVSFRFIDSRPRPSRLASRVFFFFVFFDHFPPSAAGGSTTRTLMVPRHAGAPHAHGTAFSGASGANW